MSSVTFMSKSLCASSNIHRSMFLQCRQGEEEREGGGGGGGTLSMVQELGSDPWAS